MSRTGTPHTSTITSLTSLLTLRTDLRDKIITNHASIPLASSHDPTCALFSECTTCFSFTA
jgi:hypothetical protein